MVPLPTYLSLTPHLRLIRDHVSQTLVVDEPDEDVGVHDGAGHPAVQGLRPVVRVPAVENKTHTHTKV